MRVDSKQRTFDVIRLWLIGERMDYVFTIILRQFLFSRYFCVDHFEKFNENGLYDNKSNVWIMKNKKPREGKKRQGMECNRIAFEIYENDFSRNVRTYSPSIFFFEHILIVFRAFHQRSVIFENSFYI